MSNEAQQLDNVNVSSEDGLTDYERELLRTPVKDIPPDYRGALVAMRDKKANHNHAENDKWKLEQKQAQEAKFKETLHA